VLLDIRARYEVSTIASAVTAPARISMALRRQMTQCSTGRYSDILMQISCRQSGAPRSGGTQLPFPDLRGSDAPPQDLLPPAAAEP
jgi:hypothetical protein